MGTDCFTVTEFLILLTLQTIAQAFLIWLAIKLIGKYL
jgi:hypothetical protein